MIAVHYFASVRESLGCDLEKLELPADVNTVAGLIDVLVNKHGKHWQEVLGERSVMIAVNYEIADRSASLADGDEVAFFPPVTGG